MKAGGKTVEAHVAYKALLKEGECREQPKSEVKTTETVTNHGTGH